jgi:ABC-type phosphate transport system substrate-binding protein
MERLVTQPMCRLALVALLSATVSATAQAQGVTVIVNSSNTVSQLSKAQLSDLFLRNVSKWANNQAVVPVDQSRSNKVRETFSQEVHGRSASTIDTYWQTQIFSGKNVPPVVKATDADVVAFVASTPNAIGYVSSGSPLNATVKAVRVDGM